MKKALKLVLQGLITILPLGLTIYFFIWLLMTMEKLARPALLWVLPGQLYFPGMGILAGIGVLFGVGLLVHAYAVRHLINLGENILERIPLVKSVLAAIQDMMRFFTLKDKSEMKSVVSVDIGNDMHLIGFVTGEESGKRFFSDGSTDKVGVYLPMSYQIGGYTLYVERDRITPLNMGVEEAMRIIITGGVQNNRK